MTSYQSRLGGQEGVAEELAAGQRAISIAEFFEKNKHMLGFDSGARALVTGVKEGVDNSLDACEEAGILPDIYVEIQEEKDYYRVIIEDNGPGITKEQIPKIFGKLLYGSRFHKREQSLTPDQRVLVRRDGNVEFIPIGVLCDAYLPEDGAATCPIPDDILVPSFDRQTHEMTWQPVTHAIRHETDERTYRITTQKGRSVEVTGNHSVFSVTEDGQTEELKASALESGDDILVPRELPAFAETVEEVNLLDYLRTDQLEQRRVHVCGFDTETLEQLRSGRTVQKKPSPDSPRKRTYYRYDGVDMLKDSLETDYLDKGYLPAETVLELGWETKAAQQGCEFKTYRVGGAETTVPVSLPVSDELMQLLGYYVAEGHAGPCQVGLTLGSHGTKQTLAGLGGETTTVERDRNSTRVKALGSPLALFLESACGGGAESKRIPDFVFHAAPAHQKQFITALYEGDGSDTHPDNELSHATTSEMLARQLSVLWNMRGVLASTETSEKTGGDTDTPTTQYRTKVDGADAAVLDAFDAPTAKRRARWETIDDRQGLTETDMCLLPVEDVEETTPPEFVYDISVPGATGTDENFLVANEGALSVKNSRGQQGIGISAAVLYSQLTSGKPAKITSRTQASDDAQYFEVIVDTDENEPEISVDETTTWDRPHGTRIELEMEANMRARQQLHSYIKHTAVVNPHARIELREPDAQFKSERATDQLPAETEEIRPHPHGVELGTLIKMAESTDSYSVSGFLQGEFTRVGSKTSSGVIDRFRDRYFGRELSWQPPEPHENVDLEARIVNAVANKGADATADFAAQVTGGVEDHDRIAHHELVGVVDEVGDEIQTSYGTTFGSTVREKATAAAWEAITSERESDLSVLVDAATTTRKDDAVVRALAERLAAKFEPGDRHRHTRDDLRALLDRAADMTEEHDDATFGDTARENVLAELWSAAARVPDDPPRIHDVAGDRDTASDLLEAMRETDIISPPTGCLAPITADLVEAGLRKEYDADFYAASTRDASVHGGDPFIVEAGIAYGGDIDAGGTATVLRFANRVPLVYQRGACATTDVVKNINWRNYRLDQPGGSGIPKGPAVVMIHVASTNVPFTSESKDAIANLPEIEKEIELAVREAARELKSYLNERRSMRQRREKQDKLGTILPGMAEKLSAVTGREPLQIDDTMARIMNDVLLTRDRENGTVRLVVENNADVNADLSVTEIVSAESEPEPADADGVTVVEMDGEWFLKWEPTVQSGDEATLEYAVDPAADCQVSVDGIDEEKLTIDT